MEFWEGAILVVGGVWLVSTMASNQKLVNNLPTVNTTSGPGASASPVATSTIDNTTNLTNMTNMAGGTPTIVGEPLQQQQPSVSPNPIAPIIMPVPGLYGNQNGGSRPPIPTPIITRPVIDPVRNTLLT